MEEILTEIFDREMESGRLRFDPDPEYRDLLRQVHELFPREKDLPGILFDWLDVSNQISFIHGLKLGLRLGMWAEGGV